MKLSRRVFFTFALLGFGAPSVFAQFETASVLGTVRDTTGAVVAGATVTLTNTDTGISAAATTDADGNYEFFTVRIGTLQGDGREAGVRDGARRQRQGRRRRPPARRSRRCAAAQVTETVQVTGDVSAARDRLAASAAR